MASIPEREFTSVGTALSEKEPRPSWPVSPRPQAHTVPSDFRNRLWLEPPAAATTPVSPDACTGTLLVPVVPLPSRPYESLPHPHAVPSDLTTRVWLEPVVILT